MDHKGPEHHYDELENQDPSATFFQQGEIQPETVETKNGERPFRGTPNGVRSEMTERSTPLDGDSEDRGGNPLRTDKGILAKSIIEEAEEEADQVTDPTEPAGLGETHPIKDNQWKPGDRSDRANGRDEMLGSVRHANFKSDDKIWDQVVEDFESAENHGIDEDSTGKVTAASWLENDDFDSNVPTEHLGWDIVDVVEPDKEFLEAQNKYSMPIPNGITDALHNALVELNVWVENPEENGKLRPYKEYWSVIRPKFDKGSFIQIGVEDPHHADIINHVARTNDSFKLASMSKIAGPALLPLAPLAVAGEAAAGAGVAAAEAGGAAAIGAGEGAAAAGEAAAGAGEAIGDIAGTMQNAINRGGQWAVRHEMINEAEDVGQVPFDQANATYEQMSTMASKESTYGDEYEHPSSITRRIEDPVNGGIDPHQRSDDSNDDWAYDMLDVNEIGQSRNPRGEDQVDEKRKRLFATNDESSIQSESIQKFFGLLPLIKEYINSEESCLDDPILMSLHEELEAEHPNYLDLAVPDEENEILLFLTEEPEVNSKEKKSNFFGPSTMVTQTPGATKMTLEEENPSTENKCHNCGSVVDPSDKICPKCSAPSTAGNGAESGTNPAWPYGTAQNLIQPYMSKKTSSNEQGPHTDEQQAAVAELLIEENREKEIPNMIENSHEYADELAEVQNKQPMLDEDVKDQPGPAQEQPMPNQGMPPGIPPMGAPGPADLGAPGPAAGPAPGVMASMLTAAFKHGADNVASKCPKCDSHTTKMVQQDGVSKCHTCGHQWKDKTFEKADGDSSNSSTTASLEGSNEDYNSWSSFDQKPDYESELDQSLPHDENEFLINQDEKNPTWSTDWINELEEKYPQVANMSDAKRHEFLEKRGLGNVPTGDLLEKKYVPEDIGKAASLDSFAEPEEEELEIDDSTHEWLDENGEPLKEGKEYEIYAHDYDIPDVGRIVEIKPDAVVYELESDGGLRTTIEIDRQEADQNGYRFVESGVGSEENRPGIEENMDSKPVPVPGQTTDLSTPHIQIGSSTKISFEDYDEALVTEAIEWLLSLDGPYVFNDFEGLSQEEYQDEILNMHPDYILRATDQHYGGGLDQLARDAGIANPDDNPEEGLSAFGKTAGRHYTPMEQRELIDEYGEARNADKLDLENTHYAQADDDYFLFGC